VWERGLYILALLNTNTCFIVKVMVDAPMVLGKVVAINEVVTCMFSAHGNLSISRIWSKPMQGLKSL
jgi:hypothetical protein